MHDIGAISMFVTYFQVSKGIDLPYKILAMTAKRRLFEESRDKLVVLNIVHVLLF